MSAFAIYSGSPLKSRVLQSRYQAGVTRTNRWCKLAAVKTMSDKKKSGSSSAWQRRWEPIFRAAEEGRLPNRARGVLQMTESIFVMRRARVVPQDAVGMK